MDRAADDQLARARRLENAVIADWAATGREPEGVELAGRVDDALGTIDQGHLLQEAGAGDGVVEVGERVGRGASEDGVVGVVRQRHLAAARERATANNDEARTDAD